MSVDLFAGICVREYATALDWYERLFGAAPVFSPNDVESVWELDEHRYVYVEHRPDRAGTALVTIFVDDLEKRVSGAALRGIEPVERETYDNGVRKVTYCDADGNEIGFAGASVA